MSDTVWSGYEVTFPIDRAPYTAADAGLRVTVHTERWDRLDGLRYAAWDRLRDLVDGGVQEIASDPAWPARVAHWHKRMARFSAARDAEAANATERVYHGPCLAGPGTKWVFYDSRLLMQLFRPIQHKVADAIGGAMFPVDWP